MAQILVIDDEPGIQDILKLVLVEEGHEVLLAKDGIEGLKHLTTEQVDMVFLDFRLPGKGGFDVLQEIKTNWPELEVAIISGHANLENAVKAIKLGAYDYLEKPLDMGRIITITRNAIRMKNLSKENTVLRQQKFMEDEMIGRTDSMKNIHEIINQSASSDSRIMILGENGTGKELVARLIHTKSNRHLKNFVEVNCAAIPDNLIESELFGHEKGAFTGAVAKRRGKFEIAHEGTLFLDEVADMSLEAQSKVLRAIQEMTFERVGGEDPIHVDVRIISATNKDIQNLVKTGQFREDLYFRLNVIPIVVPPLRERYTDLPQLIKYFQQRMIAEKATARNLKFSENAMKAIQEYSWPGNIRELKNFIERVTILVDEPEISREAVLYYLGDSTNGPTAQEDSLYQDMDLREAKDLFEKQMIEQRLKNNSYNVTQTAQSLGIYQSNLHNKIKKYRIELKK